MNTRPSYYFYGVSLLCFCADISSITLLCQSVIMSVVCLYIVQLLQYPTILRSCTLIIGLALESLLIYGSLGTFLSWMIPTTILAYSMHHRLYPHWTYRYLVLLSTILFQLVCEYMLFSMTPGCYSLFLKICANIIIITIL